MSDKIKMSGVENDTNFKTGEDEDGEEDSFDIANAVAAILKSATEVQTGSKNNGVLPLSLDSTLNRSKLRMGRKSTKNVKKSKSSERRGGKNSNKSMRENEGISYVKSVEINEDARPITAGKSIQIPPTIEEESTHHDENEVKEVVYHQNNSSNENKEATQKISPPTPLPKNPNMLDVNIYLGRINSYINKLGYHHSGEPSIRILTHLSLRHHMDTARQIIRSSENIKCLHALVLGIYFTNCTPIIERFPINFKSRFNGKEYRHVVLGIYLYGAYGALGISRDEGLQDKVPHYTRLSDLIIEFANSYAKSGHSLLEVKIGGIIPRDTASQCGIPWRIGPIFYLNKFPNLQQFAIEVDKTARLLRTQMGQVCIRHVRPPEMILPKCIIENPTEVMNVSGTTKDLIDEKSKIIADIRSSIASTSKSTSISFQNSIARATTATKSKTLLNNRQPIGKKKRVVKYKTFKEP